MTPKVLVTGGAGFIGSHVCDVYLDAGWEVTALDDLSGGRRENVPEGAEFIEMDIRSPDLPAVFKTRGFTHVNHHAAQVDVRISVDRPRHDASINIDGLLNVLDAARAADVERIIYVSSGGVVYGEPDPLPVEETREKLPASPYGVSKLTGEHYLFCDRALHGTPYVALRYSNVYGPRQNPHGEAGVVAIFSSRILEGSDLTVYGDGEQTRDYVYVRDVASANLIASTVELAEPRGLDDAAFNVGTGVETSVNELASRLIAVAGREVGVERVAARPGELERSALAVEKLHATGWAPDFTLDEGLRETFDWIAAGEISG